MSDQKIIRAAAAQISPVLDRPGGTLEKVLDTISTAAGDGADIIVFPETFIPYYPYFSFIEPPVKIGAKHIELYNQAVTVPGPETKAIAAAARQHGMVIVVGINERDHGTLYNTQLVFDVTGELVLKRRKITPTYHERMIWGQGDGSGLKVVDTTVGRVGGLACWEHFNPLARYSLMAQHEDIHFAQFPGSMVGQIFADQMEVAVRQHALESACFVINATGWLTDDQKAEIDPTGTMTKALSGGCCTAIVSPEGAHVVPPMTEGEGVLIADMDMSLTLKRKRMMDSVGHYSRPELLNLHIDNSPKPVMSAAQHPDLLRSDTDETVANRDELGDFDQRATVLRTPTG